MNLALAASALALVVSEDCRAVGRHLDEAIFEAPAHEVDERLAFANRSYVVGIDLAPIPLGPRSGNPWGPKPTGWRGSRNRVNAFPSSAFSMMTLGESTWAVRTSAPWLMRLKRSFRFFDGHRPVTGEDDGGGDSWRSTRVPTA